MKDFETWVHDLDECTQFSIEYERQNYTVTYKGEIVEIIEMPNDIIIIIQNSITRNYLKLSKIICMEETI